MKTKSSDLLSIVICTCDAYQDALGPLFTLLTRYWPQCKEYEIILNTESLSYHFDGLKITSFNLYGGKTEGLTWSKRLQDTLRKIPSKYVLVYLDDFYLRRPVPNELFEKCISFLEENSEAAYVNVHHCPGPYTPLKEFPLLAKRSKLSRYLINAQACIWRREWLINFVRDHETAWDFERLGSIRALFSKYDFYTVTEPLFYYRPDLDGLSRGKWLPHTPELFEEEGISVDLTQRGVLGAGDWKPAGWNIKFRNVWRSLVK